MCGYGVGRKSIEWSALAGDGDPEGRANRGQTGQRPGSLSGGGVDRLHGEHESGHRDVGQGRHDPQQATLSVPGASTQL